MSIGRRFGHAIFNFSSRDVLSTPPLEMTDAPLVFVSMLRSSDLIGYMIAIKSIYRSVGEGTVFVLDDGSLSPKDKEILHHHIPLLEIGRMDEVDTGKCPRGGTWERLCTMLDQSESRYAIQVDADLVGRGELPEVVACYRANRSFAMSNYDTPAKVTLADMSAWLRERYPEWLTEGPGGKKPHIQVTAEANFHRLACATERFYFRATSAFTGFAQRERGRSFLEDFSLEMRSLLGPRWDEWGSEQVSSNFCIANDPDSVELPSSRYVNFDPDRGTDNAVLIHFFGTYRYVNGEYRRVAKEVIRSLGRKG